MMTFGGLTSSQGILHIDTVILIKSLHSSLLVVFETMKAFDFHIFHPDKGIAPNDLIPLKLTIKYFEVFVFERNWMGGKVVIIKL